MWLLTAIALYLLVRHAAKRARPPATSSVLPVVLESLAWVLLVIWRTVGAVTRMNRF